MINIVSIEKREQIENVEKTSSAKWQIKNI